MVVNSKSDQKSSSVLQIKQDDKFFCRLLSKETSMSYPSFRVASSSSVAVPFVWESQPGTPKYTFSDNTLPPLTPPPSYYHFNNNNACKNHPQEKLKKLRPSSSSSSPKSNIFMALLPKLNLKKMMILSTPKSKSKSKSSLSSPTPSSLSCSSSHSSRVVPMAKIGMRRFLSYGSSSFDFRGDHHHHHHHHNNNEDDNGGGGGSGSPSSTLCFGLPRSTSSNSGFLSIYKRQA